MDQLNLLKNLVILVLVMKINANLIRVGNIIKYNEKMYQILGTNIIKPGKGGAFIQVEMRDVITKTKTNERWRTSDTVEKVITEDIETNYLFADAEEITVMRKDNFEQIKINKLLLAEKSKLLQDGMIITLELIDEQVTGIRLPKSIEVEIDSADAVVKGQTASSSFKPATTASGIKILVPPHIKQGDKIIINSENLEYIEKSKN